MVSGKSKNGSLCATISDKSTASYSRCSAGCRKHSTKLCDTTEVFWVGGCRHHSDDVSWSPKLLLLIVVQQARKDACCDVPCCSEEKKGKEEKKIGGDE